MIIKDENIICGENFYIVIKSMVSFSIKFYFLEILHELEQNYSGEKMNKLFHKINDNYCLLDENLTHKINNVTGNISIFIFLININ